MIVTIHTAGLQTLAQIRAFVDGNTPIAFTLTDRTAARQWMTHTLRRFHYPQLSRSDKGVLRRFLAKVTGLSRAQVPVALPSSVWKAVSMTAAIRARQSLLRDVTPPLTSDCWRRWIRCMAPVRTGHTEAL